MMTFGTQIHSAFTRNASISQSADEPEPQRLWIVNPLIDTLFICGGLLWILVAFSGSCPTLFASKTAPVFMILTQLGAIFFLDAHNAATILRIFNEKELREKYKFLWLWSPLALTLLFVLSLYNQTLLVSCLRIYLSFVPHHIAAQSYGICSMYLARAKIKTTHYEILALKFAFAFMSVTSVIRNFSGKAVRELMGVSVPTVQLFPDWLGTSLAACAWITTLFAIGIIFSRTFHTAKRLPIAAILLILSTLILLTMGPALGLAVVFSSAFFHSSQYLIVSGLVHLKNTANHFDTTDGANKISKLKQIVRFWSQTTVLGSLLYLALPTALARLGIPVINAAVAVLCFASIHHFLADAVIWRMRDPKTRSILSS